MRRAALLLAIALAGLGGLAPSGARATSVSPAAAARAATGYLLGAQNRDGGLGAAAGSPSDGLFAGWAALGLASAGVDIARLSHGGPSLLAYVARSGGGDAGTLERTILVIHAAGEHPEAFAGRDLLAALRARIRPDGSISDQVNLTAFGILALRAAGAAPAPVTLHWLIAQQDRDGGFGFGTAGGSSDPDDTGAVLEALAGAPGAARARRRAMAYLRAAQDRDGGFSAGFGSGSNAQSTAWALQGLIAAGVAPGTVHRPGGRTALEYLAALTAANGAVSYSRGTVQTPVWVTGEALMALEGRPLPIAPPPGAPGRAAAPRAGGPRPGPSHEHIRPGARRARPGPSHEHIRPGAGSRSWGRGARGPGSSGAGLGTAARHDLSALAAAAGTLTALALAPLGI